MMYAIDPDDNPKVQELMDEIKRLRRVNEQQAAGWKSTNDQLRDAKIYIQVLEDENDIFLQRIADLEEGVNLNEDA